MTRRCRSARKTFACTRPRAVDRTSAKLVAGTARTGLRKAASAHTATKMSMARRRPSSFVVARLPGSDGGWVLRRSSSARRMLATGTRFHRTCLQHTSLRAADSPEAASAAEQPSAARRFRSLKCGLVEHEAAQLRSIGRLTIDPRDSRPAPRLGGSLRPPGIRSGRRGSM